MGKYYAFHKTVKGYLHKKKNIPCEDCSESFFVENADERKQFYIAVVADGHGDTACMRSKLGSKKVAEIAKECLIEFAESALNDEQESQDKQNVDKYKAYRGIADMLANAAVYGRNVKDTLKARVPESLTNAIVFRWHHFVKEDIHENPLTEEEMAQASQYADAYREGSRLAHIYGTTLIAALMLPDYLLLIQQGDGRCDVFYEDGTVDQPIPWDERCHENVTTSMCDEDVFLRIRSRVIDLREKKVIACFLGTDGVEDAYRDMEGTHMFYRSLTAELVERGADAFENYLEEMLPQFSQIGSGDDVSVSGIVDIECARAFVPTFQLQNKQYNLKEDLDRFESRIISMSRKHGILRENMDEVKKEYEKQNHQLSAAYAECNKVEEQYREAVAKADKWKQVWKKWENELEVLKNKRRKSINVIPIPQWSYSRFSIPQDREKIYIKQIKEQENSMKKYYPEYIKAAEIETKLYDRLCEQKSSITSLEQSLKGVNKRLQKAQQEFEEYDQQYQSIKAEIERIQLEITLLEEEKKNLDPYKIGQGLEQKQEQGSNSVLHKEVNPQRSECYSAEIIYTNHDNPDINTEVNIEQPKTAVQDIQENVERSSNRSQNLQEEGMTLFEKSKDRLIDYNLQEKVVEKVAQDLPPQENIETEIPRNSDKVNEIEETEIPRIFDKVNKIEEIETPKNSDKIDKIEETQTPKNSDKIDKIEEIETHRSVDKDDKIEESKATEGHQESSKIQGERTEQGPIRFSENEKSDTQ